MKGYNKQLLWFLSAAFEACTGCVPCLHVMARYSDMMCCAGGALIDSYNLREDSVVARADSLYCLRYSKGIKIIF